MERAIRYIRDSFFSGRTFADLDDLNAQARAWCLGTAADRRWVEDSALSVRQAFEAERGKLLALPQHEFALGERVAVTVGKTPYVRFDLNDYSVPHTHVRCTLAVLADEQWVRILDGAAELARHARCWDRGQQIEIAAHVQRLVEHKRAARAHRGCDRLAQAAPASATLLERAGARGDNLGSITAALLRLLERYGAPALQRAILDALQRGVPHPNAVRLALEREREAIGQPPPVALVLPEHVARRDAPVRPHAWARTTAQTINWRYSMTETTPSQAELREQAGTLRLHGLQAHWAEVMGQPEQARWVAQMLSWEAAERGRRSLERRLRAAHIGRFKPLADFDWAWPKSIERGVVEELMTLDFLKEASNVVLVGPNGVGKTMCACNLGYQAVLAGHTALFTTAGNLLGELAALDSDSALRRKLRQYAAPDLLVIDEVGYLSYSNRHADLLFELVSRRYQNKSTVVTTNRAFAEWGQVFPNAACVVSLVDRLMHRAEVVRIDGASYRAKEADERNALRKAERSAKATASRSRKTAR